MRRTEGDPTLLGIAHRPSPHGQAFKAARDLENAAYRITEAQRQGEYRIAQLDGWSAGGGDGRGGDETSTTERAAVMRKQLREFADQIEDDLGAIASYTTSILAMCTRIIGTRDADPTQPTQSAFCDGSRFEGAELPWTPHSRDPNNGWFDATCRDIADESDLCPACKIRERRWRVEHGLAPRRKNDVQPAREVVTRS